MAVTKPETITFDNINTGSTGQTGIPAGYDGFTWPDNLSVVRPSAYAGAEAGDGFFAGLISGKQEIYNGVPVVGGGETGVSVSFGSSTPFDLKSFDITAVDDRKLQVEVKAFGDKLSFDERITITDGQPYHVKLDLPGITTVEIIPGKETPDKRFDYAVQDAFVLDSIKVGPDTAPFDAGHHLTEHALFHPDVLSAGHPMA